MDSEHTPYLENIPAYALGALDADEAAALEAHLATCQTCSAELASYREVSDALLLAPAPLRPSNQVRRNLQDRLPSRQKRASRRPAWGALAWGVGAAVVLLLVLNVFALVQLGAIQRRQAQVSSQLTNAQTALAMLSYPGTENIPIEAGSVAGRLLLDKEQNSAVVVVWDLPALPASQTYQMWLISPNGDRVSAGTFRPEDGWSYTAQSIAPGHDLSQFTGLGVTIEPAGGSPQPTGPRLFRVDFQSG
jgi:anti-sigma-K factor RskA